MRRTEHIKLFIGILLFAQAITAMAADPDCWVKLYVRENLDALDANPKSPTRSAITC